MNFKKLMVIVVPLALLIVGYQYFTKVDRTNPVKVATAFTKALKSQNTSTAASYYVPADAEAWRESLESMKSGQTARYFERVPANPDFGAPVTSKAGVTTVQSADKQYALELKQLEGKWYVSKAL